METASDRRKRKLRELSALVGGVRVIAERASVNEASLDQVIKGVLLPPKKDGSRSPRSLGDSTAHAIEDAFELGRGWFDSDGAGPSIGAYERLQALLALIKQKYCDDNAAELARRIGRSDSYVSRLFYPQGKNGAKGIGPEIMQACTEAFSLPRGYWEMTPEEASLEDGHSIVAAGKPIEGVEELTIFEYDTGGKMGRGLVLHDQPGVIRRWVVSPDWVAQNVHRITSPKNLAIVTGFGDSMRPLYNPGDPLLVDRGITRADIDGIYFFRVGEEGFVKRLQRIPTIDGVVIRAKSENPIYDPFDIVKGMDFEIFGRVVKAWRGEDF